MVFFCIHLSGSLADRSPDTQGSQVKNTNSRHLFSSYLLKLLDQFDFDRELSPTLADVQLMAHLYPSLGLSNKVNLNWHCFHAPSSIIQSRVAKGGQKPSERWPIHTILVLRRKNIPIHVRIWVAFGTWYLKKRGRWSKAGCGKYWWLHNHRNVLNEAQLKTDRNVMCWELSFAANYRVEPPGIICVRVILGSLNQKRERTQGYQRGKVNRRRHTFSRWIWYKTWKAPVQSTLASLLQTAQQSTQCSHWTPLKLHKCKTKVCLCIFSI